MIRRRRPQSGGSPRARFGPPNSRRAPGPNREARDRDWAVYAHSTRSTSTPVALSRSRTECCGTPEGAPFLTSAVCSRVLEEFLGGTLVRSSSLRKLRKGFPDCGTADGERRDSRVDCGEVPYPSLVAPRLAAFLLEVGVCALLALSRIYSLMES